MMVNDTFRFGTEEIETRKEKDDYNFMFKNQELRASDIKSMLELKNDPVDIVFIDGCKVAEGNFQQFQEAFGAKCIVGFKTLAYTPYAIWFARDFFASFADKIRKKQAVGEWINDVFEKTHTVDGEVNPMRADFDCIGEGYVYEE